MFGGAGFIGTNLCERLLADGHRVLCVDDLSTGSRLPKETPNYFFHKGDIANKGTLELLMDWMRFNDFTDNLRIINLASPASPVAYRKNPLRTLETNVQGTENALFIAHKYHASMVQVSTIKVLENTDPLGTDACYIEGKKVAEILCAEYRQKHHVNVKIARLYNTYGKYMSVDDGRVIPTFIVKALRSEPIDIWGDGAHLDSFCYIDDIVDGLMKLSEYQGDEILFTFGHPDMVSIKDLGMLIMENTSHKLPLNVLPNTMLFNLNRRQPDIQTAQNILGWEPEIDLETGLKRTIEYFQKIVS